VTVRFSPTSAGASSGIVTFTGGGGASETVSGVGVALPNVTIVATDRTATEAGLTTGAFRVSRTGSTASPLTVSYSVGGTATPGSDYVALPGTVTIAAGASTATIVVRPINDLLMEGDETVIATISADPAYLADAAASATVAITSDEKVTIAAVAPTATEAGPSIAVFRVSRTGSTASPLTVSYSVSGTATPGSDYTTLPGSVMIPAGLSTADIPVTPIDDSLVEVNETVVAQLSEHAGYTIGSPSSARVTITTGAKVTISAIDRTATEAGPTPGAFRVSRTGSRASPLTVSYSLTGTATPGSDYAALPGSVTIPAGAATATIVVTPLNDSVAEVNETVVLTLTPKPAYTIGIPGHATVTIISNE
jgi:hypothetical protein